MDEIQGERSPVEPVVDAAMQAAMELGPANTKGEPVGLGVAGLRAVVGERRTEATARRPRPQPGEPIDAPTTAERLAAPIRDSQAATRANQRVVRGWDRDARQRRQRRQAPQPPAETEEKRNKRIKDDIAGGKVTLERIADNERLSLRAVRAIRDL